MRRIAASIVVAATLCAPRPPGALARQGAPPPPPPPVDCTCSGLGAQNDSFGSQWIPIPDPNPNGTGKAGFFYYSPVWDYAFSCPDGDRSFQCQDCLWAQFEYQGQDGRYYVVPGASMQMPTSTGQCGWITYGQMYNGWGDYSTYATSTSWNAEGRAMRFAVYGTCWDPTVPGCGWGGQNYNQLFVYPFTFGEP